MALKIAPRVRALRWPAAFAPCRRVPPRRRPQRGLTLIQLMILIALLGIVSSLILSRCVG